jgi:hypothetical protein
LICWGLGSNPFRTCFAFSHHLGARRKLQGSSVSAAGDNSTTPPPPPPIDAGSSTAGYVVTNDNRHLFSAADVAAWEAAVRRHGDNVDDSDDLDSEN